MLAPASLPLGAVVQSATLFIPGAVPSPADSNAAPAFSPDGNTVYFGQSTSTGGIIVVSRRRHGHWSAPHPAPFSGRYRDLEPAFAPDGSYLIFASNRPAAPGGQLLAGHYNGRVLPGFGGQLWKVAREGQHWGKPQPLPSIINANRGSLEAPRAERAPAADHRSPPASDQRERPNKKWRATSSVFSPAIAADGALYFMRADNGGGFHVYRAAMDHGQYSAPVLVPFSDAAHGEFDPAVAPDESFVIFCSPRPPAPPHTTDLFITFRGSLEAPRAERAPAADHRSPPASDQRERPNKRWRATRGANGWSAPLDLRSALGSEVYGIEARLSPDARTLYFSNDRGPAGVPVPHHRFVWQVDLTALLRTHGFK